MTELRRGTVTFCVLAMLDERERYAVELVGDLAATEELAASQGTICPLLSRLCDDGRRSLETFRDEWAGFRDAVDRLLEKGRS